MKNLEVKLKEGIPYFFKSSIDLEKVNLEDYKEKGEKECIKALVKDLSKENMRPSLVPKEVLTIIEKVTVDKILDDIYSKDLAKRNYNFMKVKHVLDVLEVASFGQHYGDISKAYLQGELDNYVLRINSLMDDPNYMEKLFNEIINLKNAKDNESEDILEENIIEMVTEIFINFLNHIKKEYRAAKVWIKSYVDSYVEILGKVYNIKNIKMRELTLIYA